MASLLTPQGRIAPLSEEELSRLDILLASCPGGHAMRLVEADGLLAALAAGPQQAGPAAHWPVIFGRPVDSSLLRDMPHLDEAMLLLARHWNSMCDTLAEGNLLGPLLVQSPHGPRGFETWARGFLRGLRMHQDQWLPLLEDETSNSALTPVFALAHRDPAGADPVTRREAELLDDMTYALAHIHRYFRQPQTEGGAARSSRPRGPALPA